MKMKTMMTLMLLVLCLLPLSAEIETWQETKNAMLSVDLEDPQRIFTGASNATYDSGYFDSDLIGLVGVIDRTNGLADEGRGIRHPRQHQHLLIRLPGKRLDLPLSFGLLAPDSLWHTACGPLHW